MGASGDAPFRYMNRGPSVLPFVGVIAAPEIPADDVVRAVADDLFGVAFRTDAEPFDFTDYYRPEMGPGLVRFWCAGGGLASAALLPAWKLRSRNLERRWAEQGGRRVNLDPGYLSPLQLVLATTKALPTAVYVRNGIYALVELLYRDGGFEALPWTYPDYRKAAAEGTFQPFRAHFLELLRGAGR
jgi:hypothetical protein